MKFCEKLTGAQGKALFNLPIQPGIQNIPRRVIIETADRNSCSIPFSPACISLCLQVLEQLSRILLADGLLYVKDLHLHVLIPKLYGDDVSRLHVRGCLCRLVIDQHAAGIAGLIGYGTPLDQAGYL